MLQSNQPYDPNEINDSISAAVSPLAAGAAATALTGGILGARYIGNQTTLSGMRDEFEELSDRSGHKYQSAVDKLINKEEKNIESLKKKASRFENMNTERVGDILDRHGQMMNNFEKRTGQNERVRQRSQREKENLYQSGNHEAFQNFSESEESRKFNQRQNDRVTRGQRINEWRSDKLNNIVDDIEKSYTNINTAGQKVSESFDERQRKLQKQIDARSRKVGWKAGAIQTGVALGVGAFAAGGAYLLDEY